MIERILIDTTFLLPLFDIEVEKFTIEDLKHLISSGLEIYYNPISLVEIKWVILRLTKKDKKRMEYFRGIYNETIDYLLSSEELKPTILLNREISVLEDKLYDHGVKDYFDRLITATAMLTTKILVTEDKSLTRQVKNIEEFKDLIILNWEKLKQQIIA